MKKYIEYIKTVHQLCQLIDTSTTGTPEQLAKKLNLSERSVYRIVEELKELGLPIRYSKQEKSYICENGSTAQDKLLKITSDETQK